MTIDVFLSVGRTATDVQVRFVADVEQYLKEQGLNPRTVGRDGFRVRRPLKHIRDLMEQCSGTVVIAFERIHIQTGTESSGSENEQPLEDQKIPTVWNQIEAGMAYMLKQPILVIAEKGIRHDGILEPEHDWYIHWLDLDKPFIQNQDMIETLHRWKEQVVEFKQNEEPQDDR